MLKMSCRRLYKKLADMVTRIIHPTTAHHEQFVVMPGDGVSMIVSLAVDSLARSRKATLKNIRA